MADKHTEIATPLAPDGAKKYRVMVVVVVSDGCPCYFSVSPNPFYFFLFWDFVKLWESLGKGLRLGLRLDNSYLSCQMNLNM